MVPRLCDQIVAKQKEFRDFQTRGTGKRYNDGPFLSLLDQAKDVSSEISEFVNGDLSLFGEDLRKQLRSRFQADAEAIIDGITRLNDEAKKSTKKTDDNSVPSNWFSLPKSQG